MLKTFAIGCVVVVVALTAVGAFAVQEGSHAAIIGGAGVACLLLALAFYCAADIREMMRKDRHARSND